MAPLAVISALWILWLSSWLIAALWANKTVARPKFREEAVSRLIILAGALLMGIGSRPGAMDDRIRWGLAVLVLAGFVLAWWARLHLGRLWSGQITRKVDHRVVDTGPYALVRHPIYTGVTLSLIATAIALAHERAIFGATLITIGIAMRARTEERFLAAELGEAYADYARRVPMLIPFVRRTR